MALASAEEEGGGPSRALSASEAEELSRFVVLSLAFLACNTLLLALALLPRCRRGQGPGKAARPRACQSALALLLVVLLLLEVVFLGSWLLVPVVAASESWTARLSLSYVVGHALDLTSPLTTQVPSTTLGSLAAPVLGTWAMIATVVAMGLVAKLSCVERLWHRAPQGAGCFVLVTFVVLPLALLLVAGAMGVVEAAVEGWSMREGFLFMASSMAGRSHAVVGRSVKTSTGALVECLCLALQTALAGTILGFVQGHLFTKRFLRWLEGGERGPEPVEEARGARGEDSLHAAAVAAAADATAGAWTPDLPAGGPKERPAEEREERQMGAWASPNSPDSHVSGGENQEILQEVLATIQSIEVDQREAI